MPGCLSALEPWIYGSLAMNLVLSTLVIFVNMVLLFMLHGKKSAIAAIEDCNSRFQEAIRAADFARMNIVGVLLLADIMKVPREEVVREYLKDSMERRAIVYDIFGQSATTRRFVEHYASQFLRYGYEGENALLQQHKMLAGEPGKQPDVAEERPPKAASGEKLAMSGEKVGTSGEKIAMSAEKVKSSEL